MSVTLSNLVIIPSEGFAVTKDAIQGVAVKAVERVTPLIQGASRVSEPVLVKSKETVLTAYISIYGEYLPVFSDKEISQGDDVKLPVEIATESVVVSHEDFFASAEYTMILTSLTAEKDAAEDAFNSARKANKEELEKALKIANNKLLMASKAPTRLVQFLSNIQVAQSRLNHMIPTVTTHVFTPPEPSSEEDYESYEKPSLSVNPMQAEIANLKKIIEDDTNNYDRRIKFLAERLEMLPREEQSYLVSGEITVNSKTYKVDSIISSLFA